MENANEILKTLTLEEKASLCQGADFWHTKEIPGKGVPSIMVTDGPHGLRKQTGDTDMLGLNDSVPATCFPSAASICSSWDVKLVEEVGQALGEECQKEQVSVLLGPGANIKRSPLCGRNFEYFSEDPFLSSNMAKHHILGVQSRGIGTSLKHFAVNNQETRRMTVDARVDERTLREIYLASFETAVREAKPWTVMAAYNRVNGEFCCENHHLLKEVLRDEWGYEGVVVSDWGAANDQVKGIPEGFDLRMPYAGERFTDEIVEAVQSGRLSETKLDETVLRILTLIQKGSDHKKESAGCDMAAHHRLAEKAAAESAVLLKNENHALPLSRTERIAVVGALAKYVRYQGGGSSHIHATVDTNILKELDENYPDVAYTYARGYRLKKDIVDESYVEEALAAVKDADTVLYFMGLPNGWESEGYDRTHMRLPDNQVDLLRRLRTTGKRVVVFLFAGAPVEMEWQGDADGIFAMYTAGQAMPSALLKLVYGLANPCGKLAETYPVRLQHTPASISYPQPEEADYQEGIFVGYRYYDKKDLDVAYPFGYGLSYTDWTYSGLTLSTEKMLDTDTLTVSVDITNSGAMAGKEIVQLYVGAVDSPVVRPVRELKGFAKVECQPGGKRTVSFVLDKRSFAYYNTQIRDWHVTSGDYEISIGTSSRDLRLRGRIAIESTVKIPRKYDAYVTIDELGKTAVGQQFMADMMGQMTAGMPQGPTEEEKARILEDEDNIMDVSMDYAAMGSDMPLIKVSDMTAGAFPREAVYQLVAALNQEELN